MKGTRTILPLLLAMPLLLSQAGCAVTRSKTAAGATYTSASLLENAAEKTRTYDPITGAITERVVGQDQTEGAKIIAAGITTLESIRTTSDFLIKRLGKEQAIETATIEAGSQLDLAQEANRSAEAMKAMELAAPAP